MCLEAKALKSSSLPPVHLNFNPLGDLWLNAAVRKVGDRHLSGATWLSRIQERLKVKFESDFVFFVFNHFKMTTAATTPSASVGSSSPLIGGQASSSTPRQSKEFDVVAAYHKALTEDKVRTAGNTADSSTHILSLRSWLLQSSWRPLQVSSSASQCYRAYASFNNLRTNDGTS